MFDWFKKKRDKEAEEQLLRDKLAEKMKRWTQEQHQKMEQGGDDDTDYTIVGGKKVKVDRISMGNTQNKTDTTEPDFTLMDSTDFKFAEFQKQNKGDLWGQADPSDTGSWHKDSRTGGGTANRRKK